MLTVVFPDFSDYEADVEKGSVDRNELSGFLLRYLRNDLLSHHVGSKEEFRTQHDYFWKDLELKSEIIHYVDCRKRMGEWADQNPQESWKEFFFPRFLVDRLGVEGVQWEGPPTHYPFPRELKEYITESALPEDSLSHLESFMVSVESLLRADNVRYKLTPEIFSDPEYPDSNGIRLTIEVQRPLSYIYQKLKPEIYKALWRTIPDELEEKILIRFESL